MLAELLVATSLLTATLKFAGDITVQLQGDGPLQLAVINGNNQQQLRGVARVQGEIADDADLKTMVGNGYRSLPSLRKKVSAIRAWSVWKAIRWPPARKIISSVQSSCRRALSSAPAIMRRPADGGRDAAAGDAGAGCPDCRLRAPATLTETIKAEELFTLPANDVLWRLYHEEEVTVYDPQSVEFKCTCSRERCAGALKTLPDEEIDSILADEGEIDMHCDYCGNHYIFNAMDIAEIRNNASPADPQVH